VPKRVKELKKWRYKKAKELKVNSPIICNNALINSIAVVNPSNTNSLETIKNMKNWQKKEFGKEIIAVLSKVR
jgi:ribonuclease D